MALSRHCAARFLRTSSLPALRCGQRRWARVLDVRFATTHHAQESIQERYKHKLDDKAKQEGFKNVDELKEAYKEKIVAEKKKGAIEIPQPLVEPDDTASGAAHSAPARPPSQPLDQISPSSPNYKPPGVKTLSSFIDVEKTLALSPREIETLWRLRHAANVNSLCASIPLDTYKTIIATAREHPQFILPVPREGVGAEIHFLQWTFPSPDTVTVLFTHLAEYKLRGEFSQPHTTVTHHLELAEAKGLVLLQGTVVEGRGVSPDEARWLLMCMQKFYGHGQGEQMERRRKLMRQFSQGDGDFAVDELIDAAERMG